jgi:hypothetical protein
MEGVEVQQFGPPAQSPSPMLRALASLPLSRLFGGKIPQPQTWVPRTAFSEELLMQLLAAEHSEEEPDDGELSASGDDYDGDD